MILNVIYICIELNELVCNIQVPFERIGKVNEFDGYNLLVLDCIDQLYISR